MNEDKLIEIFISVDDFCKKIAHQSVSTLKIGGSKDGRSRLSTSEIISILVCFHLSGYYCFKCYYTNYVQVHWKNNFPGLVSYNRFIELQYGASPVMFAWLEQYCKGKNTGLGFVDSTKLAVSHNRRIHSHKVFITTAKRGKTSVDWFYGFKLHLAINHQGELIGFSFTSGNVDDRNRKVIKRLVTNFKGILIGDRGYVGKKLAEELSKQGVELIAKRRKNMKPQQLDIQRKLFLKHRALVESVYDVLKDCMQLEHSRYRSDKTISVNVLSALMAYCFRDNKPHLYITRFERLAAKKLVKLGKSQAKLALAS